MREGFGHGRLDIPQDIGVWLIGRGFKGDDGSTDSDECGVAMIDALKVCVG